MTVRVKPAAAPTVARSIPWRAPARPPVQAGLAALAPSVSAIFVDRPAGGPARLAAAAEGAPLPRPLVATALALADGGTRHVVLVGEDATALARRTVSLDGPCGPVARLDPEWLQSPLRPVEDLFAALAPAGRARLARLLPGAGAALFCRPGGAAALAGLLDRLGVTRLEARGWFPLGARAGLLAVEAASDALEAPQTFVLAAGDRVRAVPGASPRCTPAGGGALLCLRLPERPPTDGLLVGFGASVVAIGLAAARPRALAPWARSAPAPLAGWLVDQIESEAGADDAAAAILDEIRFGDGEPPAVRLRHLSAAGRGLLVLAEIDDPRGLARGLSVGRGEAVRELVPDPERSVAGGYLDLGDAAEAGEVRIDLVWRSGRVTPVHRGEPEAFDGTLPPAFARLPRPAAAEALARARIARCAAAPRRPRHLPTPEAGARPSLAIVVTPGGGCPELIRARAAALAPEQEARRVEVVHVVNGGAPEEVERVRAALDTCRAVFGLTMRLVVAAPGAEPAAALAAGLAAIRAERALVLGGDVLPVGRGWLGRWLRALGRGRAPFLLGSTLLGIDGAVLHAGGAVRRGDGTARLRAEGLPARDLPRRPSARTALVTAAGVGLGRAAIAGFLAASGDYPEPDVLLARLALDPPAGARPARTLLDARLVRYAPPPEADPLAEAVDAAALALLRRAGEG